jgi:hypothetical protein
MPISVNRYPFQLFHIDSSLGTLEKIFKAFSFWKIAANKSCW